MVPSRTSLLLTSQSLCLIHSHSLTGLSGLNVFIAYGIQPDVKNMKINLVGSFCKLFGRFLYNLGHHLATILKPRRTLVMDVHHVDGDCQQNG